jgi:chromosome segregation ATPase
MDDLSMKPSRDDLVHRQGKGKPPRRRQQKLQGDGEPVAKTRNGPILVVLLLIVAGAGAGGWLMWQEVKGLSAELAQSRELLSQSQSNLGDLQQNIASQSSAIDQTGSKIQEQLDFHMSEIRKLWDLSNKANKPAIEANEKAIAGLKSTLSGQKKLIGEAESAAKSSRAAVTSLETQVKQGQLQTSAINSQVDALQAQLTELEAQNQALRNMLDSQEAALTRLQASSGKLLKEQLADIQQRLDSVDAFRRQVNSRLTQHDRSIAELAKTP